MMRKILFVQIMTIITAGSLTADEGEPRATPFLVDLDREIAGLLDAYLEAVPECPACSDTPLRLWVLDLAFIRADAAMLEAETIDMQFSGSIEEAWLQYLDSSREYIRIFLQIQNAYHSESLPEATECVELENNLLIADSLWRIDETELFELLSKEENQ
jgi:hypothetical protein